MRAILPGRPQPKLQAVTTGAWEGQQIIAYISGDALVILSGPNRVLQTIYIEEDKELQAITFDEASGKIAVSAGGNVYIYRPYGQDEGAIKWSLQSHIGLDNDNDHVTTLSWGLAEELLVGSSSLTLFATHSDTEQLWVKKLANSVKFANFSYDATMIASTGEYDCLLKIWHRLAFGSVDQRFDYAYLPHPTAITGVHWRKPFHREQSLDNVLYTICADNRLRIWVPGEPQSLQIMHLWGEIDLMGTIQPRSLEDQTHKRYAFIIDSRDFTLATERAVQQSSGSDRERHALEHLIEVANRNPEVCVVLDDRGHMSAWGLESVGCKSRKPSDIFNFAHVEGLKFHFAKEPTDEQDNVQFINFCGETAGSFTILAHHFDGRLEWLESRIDILFDPSPQDERLERKAVWTGHSSPIKKVNRTATGRALVSRAINDETIIWTQRASGRGVTLHRHSTVATSDHIHRTALLQEGDFVVFLHYGSVSLWDARGPMAVEVARCEYEVPGKPLCLLVLPETQNNIGCVHIATITSEMKGIAWEIKLPPSWTEASSRRFSVNLSPMVRRPSRLFMNGTGRITMSEYCTFDLGVGEGLSFVLPVDPAGTAPVISGFLDTFARDVAISYTKSGELTCWTARVDAENSSIDWLVTSKVETNIVKPSLASGTSIRKAALVDADKTTLTVWNTRAAQLEYKETFENNSYIQDLDWASTPDNQSILAVGFPHRVVVYTQLRYDYLDAGPSWAPVREFQIRDTTPHPIGDSVWLSNGHLVIGDGNQLFIQDEHIEISDSLLPDLRMFTRHKATTDIFNLASSLNGPIPVYHPQFLAQCMLAGKGSIVQTILINLYKTLKFWVEGEEIDSFLGLSPDDFSREDLSTSVTRKTMSSSYGDFTDDTDPTTVTEDVVTSLTEKLTSSQIPRLSSREQFHLADIIECVGTVEKLRRSIDVNASRFLVFFRQHMLRTNKHTPEEVPLTWREMVWAFFSESQDILVDQVSRHFSGRMLWEHARQSGIFMWMTDLNSLRAHFEVIARNEYTKTDDKNPVDCSLYYLALKKKPVLVGLWRMATWSREQGATQRLLSNNFSEPRWKTAALKNAYALMGKRRFEYAAAFFLLADHLSDAVSVLANQLGDLQLAIAVARVYEGDDGPVLQKFIKDRILPHAVEEGNRWLATWAFWMLKKRDSAVRALVTPLSALVSPPETPKLQSKLFLADDPALVVLYKQLRERSLQTLRGAVMVSPRAEWEFVIHTAEIYERMGCDLLALDLVRNWEFLLPSPPKPAPLTPAAVPQSPMKLPGASQSSLLDAFDVDPRKLLRRRSSLVVADLPTRESVRNALQEPVEESDEEEESEDDMKQSQEKEKPEPSDEKKKPLPTQFHEPDTNSLLDSFGF